MARNTVATTALLYVWIVVAPTWYNCWAQGNTILPSNSNYKAKGPYHAKAVRDWMNARCNNEEKPPPLIGKNVAKKRRYPRKHNDDDENQDELQIPSGSAIWIYQGGLYDPLDGRQIANVEGVELVRHLGDCYANQLPSRTRYQTRCLDLQAPQFLNHTDNDDPSSSLWDYATTCLTRKMFCYTTPRSSSSDKDDRHFQSQQPQSQQRQRHRHRRHSPSQQLLSHIRLRPTSPQRRIPTEQAVALYDSATTFVSRCQGQELLVHTEKPDTTTFWGEALATITNNNHNNDNNNNNHNNKRQPDDDQEDTNMDHHHHDDSPPGNFDLTVYAKRRATNDLPSMTSPSRTKKGDSLIVSPKRAKWIQFGSGNNAKGGGSFRLGARETYHYYTTTVPPSPSKKNKARTSSKSSKSSSPQEVVHEVRYTRYGEGPPWYGPHKMCTLELQGRRITSMTQIPSLSANLIADHIPGFLSVHTPLPYVPEWEDEDVKEDDTRKRPLSFLARFRRRRPSSSSSSLEDVEDWKHAMELSDQAAAQSVHWYRDCQTLPLKLHNYQEDDTGKENGGSGGWQTKFHKWWHKLDKASRSTTGRH